MDKVWWIRVGGEGFVKNRRKVGGVGLAEKGWWRRVGG